MEGLGHHINIKNDLIIKNMYQNKFLDGLKYILLIKNILLGVQIVQQCFALHLFLYFVQTLYCNNV